MTIDPNTWLRRGATAEALSAAGFSTSAKTLQTAATRDPTLPYRINGKVVEYRWEDALRWRMSKVRYRGAPAASARQDAAA